MYVRGEIELVELANENFVASFRKLVEHTATGATRQFGGVFAFVSDLPLSLFNGCAVVEPGGTRDLDAALRWVVSRRVPHRVFVAAELEADLAAVAAAHGLERDPVPYPGMVLHPIPDPPELPDDVEVRPIGESDRDEFLGVGEALGLPRDLAEALFSRSFLRDAEVQAFVGHLGGHAVGYSLAIRSAGATGVYNVGTLPSARRRGVGTALTGAAVAAGRAAGFDCAVLQSSEMAVSMYEAMGFRTVAPYVVFRQPSLAPLSA
jgi:ribosomal protein S18 acetylase RimI-like enzyme